MMSSRFTSDEMGHNPQAPGPAKKQALLLKENPGRSYDFINRRSYRSNAKHESCEGTIDVLFGLQNQWIFPNLVRRQEKFCNACGLWPISSLVVLELIIGQLIIIPTSNFQLPSILRIHPIVLSSFRLLAPN